MEAVARTRYMRVSAKKVNRILPLIRNVEVPHALNTLTFLRKTTKDPILKTLKSAVANALTKGGRAKLSEENLYVKEARVDQGPSLKRFRAGARGRAAMIRRHTAHITIRVATKEE